MKATEYVVLTERPNVHLVVVRYGDEPWLKVVAAFPQKDRADAYAAFETECISENDPFWPDDVTLDAPAAPEVASALPVLADLAKRVATKPAAAAIEGQQASPEEIAPEPQKAAVDQVEEPSARIDPSVLSKVQSEADRIVAEMYLDHTISTTQIAKRAGIHQPKVSAIARRLGLPLRGRLRDRAKPAFSAGENNVAAPPAEDVVATRPVDEKAEPDLPPVDGEHAASAHGVTIVMRPGDECITKGGKVIDLTMSQAKTLAVLLRAAPHPVSVPFIVGKVYPSVSKIEAEERLGVVTRDLQKGLPAIGLELKAIKGVGLALGGAA